MGNSKTSFALALAVLAAVPAAAQQSSPQYVRPIAAGYKAGFLSSKVVRRGFDTRESRFDPAALTRDVLAGSK